MPRKNYSYLDSTSYVDAIAGEVFRSYGYGRNEQTGQYEMSFDNVVKAYRDHPFWTAFDHLTLAYGPARLAMGAYSVTKGAAAAGAVGKALSAGYFAKAGRGFTGEVYQAARALRGAPAADTVLGSKALGKTRQFFESPLKFDRTSDYWKIVNTPDPGRQVRTIMRDAPEILFGHDLGAYNKLEGHVLRTDLAMGLPEADTAASGVFRAADRRGEAMMLKRERKSQMAAIGRNAKMIHGQLARLTLPEQESVSKLLELSPTGNARAIYGPELPGSRGIFTALGEGIEMGAHAKIAEGLSPKAQLAYQRSFDFRNSVHEEAFRLGYISEETYVSAYQRYAPHIPKKYNTLDPADKTAHWAGGDIFAGPLKEGANRFRKRESLIGDGSYLLSPGLQIEKVAGAAMVLAQHRYGVAISKSIIAMDESRVVNLFGSVESAVSQGWTKIEDLFPGRAMRTGGRLSSLRREYKALNGQMRTHLADVEAVNKIMRSNEVKLTGMESASLRALLKHELASGNVNVPVQLGAAKAGDKLGPRGLGRALQREKDLIEEMGRTHTNKASVANRVSNRLTERGDVISRRLARKAETIAKEEVRAGSSPMMKNVPDALIGKYIDPLAADDVKGMFSDDSLLAIEKIYHGIQAAFKLSHTAYNPATQIRNGLGNIVFHSMANGGFKSPHVGVTALYNWTKGVKDDYTELVSKAVESGVLGSSRNAETMLSIQKSLGGGITGATGMDWVEKLMSGAHAKSLLPAGTLRRRITDRMTGSIQASAAKAETLYGAVDEVFKLDTFIRQHAKLSKLGLDGEEVTAKATQHVMNYFPNYSQGSAFVDMLAPHVPFMSFGTESVRVFSNVLRDKPHWAFFWNHVTESASQAFGAMNDITPEEQESAKKALPWYTQGKKMLMLPWRDDDGKPHFLDLSYIIPMADMGAESEQAEKSFFGVPVPQVIDPTTNPVLQIAAAAATGISPFTGRPIEPQFLEQQMGVYLNGKGERFMAGLGEHILRTMLPPLVPPSYAGTNLVEAMRQTRSGYTNRPLEENIARTFAMNVLGMRTYEPTVAAQLVNVKHEQRSISETTTHAWDQFEMGVANGNLEQAEAARARIIGLKDKELGTGGGSKWFDDNVDSHQPGGYSNVSRKEIEEIVKRSQVFNTTPTELAPLYNRLRNLRKGSR